jgi:hypothetical protein
MIQIMVYLILFQGQRIIIINSGGKECFIPNPYACFKSHLSIITNTNFRNYEKLLKVKLISNPLPHSVIAWGMPPYHNVQVNLATASNSRKSDLTSWLNKKGLSNEEVHCTYRINRLLAGHNHKML